jgi:hypothetical protein
MGMKQQIGGMWERKRKKIECGNIRLRMLGVAVGLKRQISN